MNFLKGMSGSSSSGSSLGIFARVGDAVARDGETGGAESLFVFLVFLVAGETGGTGFLFVFLMVFVGAILTFFFGFVLRREGEGAIDFFTQSAMGMGG